MHAVDVTPRVWDRLLSVRTGQACACCGRFSAGERAALDLYAPVARRDLGPVTIAQIGQSLDGRVATATGDARDVSVARPLPICTALRAGRGWPVIRGQGPALHDQPRLTVRLCSGHNPARIVIDPRGRLPDDALECWWRMVRGGSSSPAMPAPRRGIEVLRLPAPGRSPGPHFGAGGRGAWACGSLR